MKKEYLEAYEFYKRQHPGSVILFHMGNSYYAFENDAWIVAKMEECYAAYNYEEEYYWYRFHQDALESMCSNLRNIAQTPVTVVDYRNSQGSFDIPKVKQILQDMEDDY